MTVRASDGVNQTDKTITVSLTDANDNAPVITTLASQSIAENQTLVTTLASTDADAVGTNPATFSIVGGADQALFDISGGNLVFRSARDFETQAHSYQVTVRASDGVNQTDKTITVSLTDVNEVTHPGTDGKDKLKGTKGDDVISGQGGNDKLKGGKGNDVLDGGNGKDKLDGSKGDDILIGGAGKDVLTGGKGADIFVFQFASDSTVKGNGRDVIQDFNRKQGDKIDVSAIDPLNGSGVFDFIGKAKFSGEEGELRYQKTGGKTLISGDIDGDGKADFAIQLSKAMTMKEADFIL